jgi:hypothetical protein
MQPDFQDKCLCGHRSYNHYLGFHGPYCQGCSVWGTSAYNNYRHEFKLDNLALIEKLAKERGLV